MATSSMLRAKGLNTFYNFLSSIPEGSLFEADNVNIDRDGVLEPRRGIKTFKDLSHYAKQLMFYKDQLLVHLDNKIQYQTALESTTFSTFKSKKFFTITSATNYILLNNHGLSVDDPVTFIDVAGASGISVGPTYYVKSVTSNTFQIATTLGGPAITFTTGTTGLGTISYEYVFNEVASGLRLKSVEFNGNLYVTTNDGIKKISTLGDYNVSNAGGIAAFDCNLSLDLSTDSGFFGPLYDTSNTIISSDVEVAYRVTWGTKDINGNFIEGAPSARSVITNRTGTFRNVNVGFTVPSEITTDYFFRVYRTNVNVIGGSGDEMRLVFEAPFSPTATIANEGYIYTSATSSISLNDSQTNELRNTGSNLYTNEISGEGITQSNNRPPVAKDIALYKNVTFYANTRTAHKKDITFLGFDNAKYQDVSSISGSSPTTLNFSSAHNLSAGDYIALAGTTAIDGQYEVLATPTSTSLTINNTNPTLTTLVGGAVVYKAHFKIYKNRATVDEIVRRYFLVGRPEKWDITVLDKNSMTDGDYFQLNSADDALKYHFWISKGTKYALSSANFDDSNDKITYTTHGFSDGDIVYFSEDSIGLPSEFRTGVNYYIVSSTANDFKLSLTSGGAHIDFTAASPGGLIYIIKDGVATAPVISGSIAIKVDINTLLNGATADEVAEIVKASLEATGDFVADRTGGTLATATATSGKIDDVTSGTESGTSFTITKTQDGFGEDNTKNFVRRSGYVSPALSIEDTAKSLVSIINRDTQGLVNAYYTSSNSTLPGQFNLEAKTIDATPFELIAINSAADASFGAMFNPDLSTYSASENDVAANKIYFSKTSQPEAVPISNNLTVGPKNKAILRILGLRDSLFILKEEGIYRLTGFNSSNFSVALFDNSASIAAPDTAAILNNQIYCLTTQGLSTISETGVGVISRPIENLINAVTAPSFTNYTIASFGVSYEADRSYLLWVAAKESDEYATKAYRYNTFTQCWTAWDVTARCGIVDVSKNKLYIGAGDINAIEVERKTLTSRDYADREYSRVITNVSTDGIFIDNASNIKQGDMLTQTQYVSIAQFNRFVKKVNSDPAYIAAMGSPFVYIGLEYIEEINAGASMMATLNNLANMLYIIDPTAFMGYLGPNALNTEDAITCQTRFNAIVGSLNVSFIFQFNNYLPVNTSTTIDLLVSSVNRGTNELLLASGGPFLLGDITHYKGIQSLITWSPIALGDPAISKHVRSGTVMLESNGLFGGVIGYASDISGNFEDTDFGMDGSGRWGASIFGNTAWGGVGTSYPLRTLIPRQKQRCRYLEARFKHNTAMFKYAILGISYTFEATSDRAWR